MSPATTGAIELCSKRHQSGELRPDNPTVETCPPDNTPASPHTKSDNTSIRQPNLTARPSGSQCPIQLTHQPCHRHAAAPGPASISGSSWGSPPAYLLSTGPPVHTTAIWPDDPRIFEADRLLTSSEPASWRTPSSPPASANPSTSVTDSQDMSDSRLPAWALYRPTTSV